MSGEVHAYSIKVKDFDLDKTLDCGQTFRWYKSDEGWHGVIRDRVVFARQRNGTLEISTNKPWSIGEIVEYFGLRDDLKTIKETLLERAESFPKQVRGSFEKAFNHSWGLRILRQDPYEMTASYLFSVQTSIPLIQRRLEALARFFPENRIEFLGKEFYLFPTLDQLKRLTMEKWLSLGLGFRAKWLYHFARKMRDSFFARLRDLSLSEKLEELTRINGIGYKVASCVTLFGYGELNSFPVDVWIRKALKDLFGVEGSTKRLMEKGMELFEPFAGYAQEYLFREYRTVRRLDKS